MEIELKHLTPYLPHELQVYHSGGVIVPMTIEPQKDWKNNGFGINEVLEYSYLWPLLIPTSALYEEIDGEIGIVELAKIATEVQDWEMTEYQPTFGSCKIKLKPYMVAYNEEYNCRFFLKEKDFYLYDIYGARECTHQNQLALFDYLDSRHYDHRYNLIGKGLAMDKRSVK